MNSNEVDVLHAMVDRGVEGTYSIAQIIETGFPGVPSDLANSSVRNSLRRLVRGGWVVNVYPGNFRIRASRVRELIPLIDAS